MCFELYIRCMSRTSFLQICITAILLLSLHSCGSHRSNFAKQKYLNLKPLKPIQDDATNLSQEEIFQVLENDDTIKLESGNFLTGKILLNTKKKVTIRDSSSLKHSYSKNVVDTIIFINERANDSLYPKRNPEFAEGMYDQGQRLGRLGGMMLLYDIAAVAVILLIELLIKDEWLAILFISAFITIPIAAVALGFIIVGAAYNVASFKSIRREKVSKWGAILFISLGAILFLILLTALVFLIISDPTILFIIGLILLGILALWLIIRAIKKKKSKK